jgi:hypothetical protein
MIRKAEHLPVRPDLQKDPVTGLWPGQQHPTFRTFCGARLQSQ